MPLPPKPKRPLGPPTLFYYRYVAIRTRADAIQASGSWDEFLDDMADLYVGSFDNRWFPMDLLRLVERLVPRAEMQPHREAMGVRIRERQDANLAHLRQVLDDARTRRPGFFARLFGRAA